MSIASSQKSGLNPFSDVSEVVVTGGRKFGDIEEVIVSGNRIDKEDTLESVIVDGTRNAPTDGLLLEEVIVDGVRKKQDPIHLHYPKNLQDPTSEFKNAIQFTVYKQKRSQYYSPGLTPAVKELPEQFKNQPGFPISSAGFNLSAGKRAAESLGVGGVAQVVEDLAGLAAFGAEFFVKQGFKEPTFGQRTQKLDQTITLYMPDTVVNQDRHDYKPVSVTAATGRAGLYSAGLSGAPIGKVETAMELATKAGIFGTNAPEAVLSGLGYAMNPMLEILYGGSNPREFLFQFRFAPRNEKEAIEVIKIIKSFRFHAATEGTGKDPYTQGVGTRYIVPPNHFEIQFLRRKNGKFVENLAIPRVTTCVLTGINTNYAAQLDTFTTTTDGIPTSISLDLSFTETVVLTKSDIRNGY